MGDRGARFYGRVTLYGIAVIGVGCVVALVSGSWEGMPLPFAVVMASFALLGHLRGSAWPFVPVALLSVSGVALGSEVASFAGATFAAAPYFVPALATTAGAALALVGSVVSIGERVTRWRRAGASVVERAALVAAITAFVALSVVSAVSTATTESTVPLADRVGAVRVRIGDDWFRPRTIQAEPGAELRLWLRNEGNALHTFTLDELDVDKVMIPGRELVVTVRPAGAGTYAYTCRVSGHDDQRGNLVVGR